MDNLKAALENELQRYEREQHTTRIHHPFRQRPYAMKLHDATRLHYDLRLEWNDILLSWAIPDGPSCVAGLPRKAIEMDDHRLEYIMFEGVHPTGPIILWDLGAWEPFPDCDDVTASLRRGILRFRLYGEKLKGGWILRRTARINPGLRPVWTLSKLPGAFARSNTDKCILEELPNSVNGGTMEEIIDRWIHPRNRYERQGRLFEDLQ